jgi:hypothetical protein
MAHYMHEAYILPYFLLYMHEACKRITVLGWQE